MLGKRLHEHRSDDDRRPDAPADGLSVSATDVGEFGDGGMRGGTGTGSITVSGVSAPVFHAFLYWNGPTNSSDPGANAP